MIIFHWIQSNLNQQTDTDDQATDQGITHVEEVVKNTEMTTSQRPRVGWRLDNLNVENFENLLLVGDAIHRNQREYLNLHLELEKYGSTAQLTHR